MASIPVWLDFSVRILAFLASFWLLMEYLILSSVSTTIGCVVIMLLLLGVLLYIFLYRSKKVVVCECCNGSTFLK